jgi:predicted GNAT family acetyltransferase
MTGGYIERTFAAVRRAVEAGAGEWWGAWDGERAIAQMGLFREGALARFKDVETHPDYRRRGACRSLLYRVCETAAGGSAQLELVIVPADDAVRRVYEAVGFRYREKVADLCRMPPG